MSRFIPLFIALFAISSITPSLALAQVRVTPEKAKGGKPFDEPWAGIPESFRDLKIPDWQPPTDLQRWETIDRPATRKIVLQCLGDMPPRPDPAKVKVLSREEFDTYTLEHFEFHNGIDMIVPGILAIPKMRSGPVPVIIGMHGHSGSKAEYLPNAANEKNLGTILITHGYAVAAIDGYFNGDRLGKGPIGRREKDLAAAQELALFKLHLWQGHTLWGLMVRDEQCLLDYLETRPEIDKTKIGATGMSMGCTRAWWVSALDDRVKAIVGVCCFTRYTELLAHGSSHGIYYFVPGILKHFDSEAIYALTAPRPMLMLSGDQDRNAPPDGVEMLEKKVGAVYKLYGKPENFRSVLYKNTGHEYLHEMKVEMAEWFERHLPTRVADQNLRIRAQNRELQRKLDNSARQRDLLALLVREMQSNTGFKRIHAAEALIAHGQTETVAKFFQPEIETSESPYRIGIWRVMARAAATEAQRLQFVERIRTALLDPAGPDRLHAAESLAKLGKANPADRSAIAKWEATLDDADGAFPRWLLLLGGSAETRAADEAHLVKLLESKDAIARLRTGFAIGSLTDPSAASLARLQRQAQVEPADSPARAYLIAAVLLHTPRESPAYAEVKKQLSVYLETGKSYEQLQAASAIGQRGTADDLPALSRLLNNPEADARIGGATGSLYLLQ
jgi:dienelactone hydrolase